MSAYVIVEFTVTDPDLYRQKYAPTAGQTAKELPTPTEDTSESE